MYSYISPRDIYRCFTPDYDFELARFRCAKNKASSKRLYNLCIPSLSASASASVSRLGCANIRKFFKKVFQK